MPNRYFQTVAWIAFLAVVTVVCGCKEPAKGTPLKKAEGTAPIARPEVAPGSRTPEIQFAEYQPMPPAQFDPNLLPPAVRINQPGYPNEDEIALAQQQPDKFSIRQYQDDNGSPMFEFTRWGTNQVQLMDYIAESTSTKSPYTVIGRLRVKNGTLGRIYDMQIFYEEANGDRTYILRPLHIDPASQVKFLVETEGGGERVAGFKAYMPRFPMTEGLKVVLEAQTEAAPGYYRDEYELEPSTEQSRR